MEEDIEESNYFSYVYAMFDDIVDAIRADDAGAYGWTGTDIQEAMEVRGLI